MKLPPKRNINLPLVDYDIIRDYFKKVHYLDEYTKKAFFSDELFATMTDPEIKLHIKLLFLETWYAIMEEYLEETPTITN